MLRNFVPLFFYIGLNAFFCVVNRCKFGEILPFTLMFSVFIEYCSQLLFGTFNYGFYILIILAIVGLIFVFTISGGWKNNRELILTNGLYAFIAIVVVYFIIDFGRKFSLWDEFMHWGKMVKEMLRLDKFYYVNESTLLRHKDYPPFISLFELIWCKLSGGYSEMGVSMSIHVFELSIITPFLFERDNYIKEKKVCGKIYVQVMITLFFITLILFLDNYGTFHTIYTDILVGLVFSYSMYLIYSRKIFDGVLGYTTYVLSLVSILYIKQIGLAFVGISFLYFVFITVVEKRYTHKLGLALKVLFPMMVCSLGYMIWNMKVKSYGIVGQFDVETKIDLNTFVECLNKKGLQHDTIKRFINALFQKNIVSGVLPITFASSMLIVVVLMELTYHFSKGRLSRREKIGIEIILSAGAIGYALVMLILYTFCFEESEMINLGSFSRYMGSYFTAEVIFIVLMNVDLFGNKISRYLSCRYATFVVMIEMILLNPTNMLRITPQYLQGESQYDYKEEAEIVNNSASGDNKVYVNYIRKNADDKQVYMSYYTDDVFIAVEWKDLLNTDYSQNEEEFEEAIEMLKNYDYMYVSDITDSFNEYFSQYNSGENFKAESVYEIDSLDGEIHFVDVTK